MTLQFQPRLIVGSTNRHDIRAQGDPQPASATDAARAAAEAVHLADLNNLLKQEIAHRRRAEEANAKFAAIVESSSDAIIGQKLDGTIVTWNKGAEKIYGYTSEEACGRTISILAPPERVDEITRIVQAIRRGDVVHPFETERLRKDGQVI